MHPIDLVHKIPHSAVCRVEGSDEWEIYWIIKCAVEDLLIRTDQFRDSGIHLTSAKDTSGAAEAGEEPGVHVAS